jgi:serine protease Do
MLPVHTQQVTWLLQQALSAPDRQGALVISIQDDDGKMLQGKINPGDIIRTFNGETVWDSRDLARKAAITPPGGKAVLELYRAGETLSVEITIHAWPEAKPVVLNDDGARPLGLDLIAGRDDQGRSVVTVASVDANGTAAASGLRNGDVIVEVQQTPVSEPDEALRILWAQSVKQRGFAAVLVQHDKQLLWMSVAIPN